jgi:hypothetical protein
MRLPEKLSYPAHAGYPVRATLRFNCGLSEYWIARFR